ncbi:MAG: hypothetical protein CSA45_05530 [Gammaproteobacteria bacterium]|nr:MAG: hypothetical protein CSA45_05530 [Gammaproteobacteria bacterium]
MTAETVAVPRIRVRKVAELTAILLLAAAILYLGFLIRFSPALTWDWNPASLFISEEEPVLSNLDGHYYLKVAQEVREGKWENYETLTAWPDRIPRSSIPPLAGVLAEKISTVTGMSLNEVGIFLPCLLSLFVAVPIYFFAARWGGWQAGLAAVMFYVTSPVAATRNSYGFFDTDCLNTFFPLASAALALLFGTRDGKERYLYLAGAFLVAGLYFWWWDQVVSPPAVLGLFPVVYAIVFLYRVEWKEATLFAAVLSVFLICILLYTGVGVLGEVWKGITGSLHYISKGTGLYRNVGLTIGEQSPLALGKFFDTFSTCPAVGAFGFFSLAVLFVRRYKEALILAAMLAVGVMAFLYARRFAIFIVPLLCIALGYGAALFYKTIHIRLKWRLWRLLSWGAVATAVVAVCAANTVEVIAKQQMIKPIFSAGIVTGMKHLQEVTEKDAVIWSWWDEGHLIKYYARRETINDGMVHDGERNFNTAFPLIQSNDRIAANFMRFYSVHGKAGFRKIRTEAEKYGLDGIDVLKKMLAAGPENYRNVIAGISEQQLLRWRDYLFPESKRPIYLFVDQFMFLRLGHMHDFGTWDVRTGKSKATLPLFGMPMYGDAFVAIGRGFYPGRKDFAIVPESGMFLAKNWLEAPVAVKSMYVTNYLGTKKLKRELPYKGPVSPKVKGGLKDDPTITGTGDYVLDINIPKGYVSLKDEQNSESLVNRFFIRDDAYNRKYFTPIEIAMEYQIWRVNPDPPWEKGMQEREK